uniref:Uncharacterized protein n=1 Tax=Phlebotomus papatasi TaxID=29031 RepID=A0A1B0GNP7_PHLPP
MIPVNLQIEDLQNTLKMSSESDVESPSFSLLQQKQQNKSKKKFQMSTDSSKVYKKLKKEIVASSTRVEVDESRVDPQEGSSRSEHQRISQQKTDLPQLNDSSILKDIFSPSDSQQQVNQKLVDVLQALLDKVSEMGSLLQELVKMSKGDANDELKLPITSMKELKEFEKIATEGSNQN